ncbi:MAG: 3-oxoacyl-ACP synthase [Pedobacter sp.]|nr:MAG: 3-oxoacyl-ACP synthase [Pedobacter sp.]
MQQIKETLYQLCLGFIEQRIQTAETALEQARESSNDDTRSSAGDKYETSREMMQQEIDRNKRLLIDAEENLRILKAIDITANPLEIVRHGSLVDTNQGSFYISVSAGQLAVDGKTIFAVSPASPIGKTLLNKKKGGKFDFNGKAYEIQQVI